MIDVHAHVFNLGYVPVRGIIESRRRWPRVAAAVARLLEDALARDEHLPDAVAASLVAALAAGADAARTADIADRSRGDLVTAFVAGVSTGYLESHARDLDEGLAALDTELPAVAAEQGPDAARDAAVVAELEALPAGALRGKLWRLLRRVAHAITDGAALIDWFLLLLARETDLVSTLRRAWPDVELFVHHMMDMDNHYPPGRSLYPFDELQLRRMRVLTERSGGRLLTFVAYDPFREDGVAVVEQALHRGCGGVKFYPPSGYRPIGNTAEDLAGTEQDAATVDARNLELFAMCVRLDAPIFAHCSPGGMERRPRKSGLLADPRGWRRVLERPGLERLRLCLGHAGGDEGWCLPPERDDEFAESFVPEVIALCADPHFPNVYCEFGHLEQIFNPTPRAHFARRLGHAVRTHGEAFGRKCLYGSDWHLLARSPEFARFDDLLRTVFRADEALRQFEQHFFRLGALAYLNLSGYLDRNAGVLTRTEEQHLRDVLEGHAATMA